GPSAENREASKLFRKAHSRIESAGALKTTGPLGRPAGHPSGPCAIDALGRERYFCVTAPLATPPPADCAQIVVGRNGGACLNCHVPPAALVVPMTAPGQLVPTAAPSWMVTLAAKPPPGIWVLVPSTRSSPVATLSSLRAIDTVSLAAAGLLTICVTTAEVLAANVALPL